MSSKAVFKFNEAAKAYLDASNDLLEEIETRGFAAASRKEIWAALNAEWDARQAVLDAGPTGNYDEVVRTYRGVAIACAVGFAAGSIAYSAVMARRAVIEARKANRRARRAETRMYEAWSEQADLHEAHEAAQDRLNEVLANLSEDETVRLYSVLGEQVTA